MGSSFYKKLIFVKRKRYTWQDDEHLYYFGVCTKAYNGSKDNEGLVQINKKTQQPYVIGRLADVDLEGLGTDQKFMF